MKAATLPPLRVDPELRESAERMLKKGETLSAFIETAVRNSIRQRQVDEEFLARGLQAREEAKATSGYFDAKGVLDELESMLSDTKKAADH
jgi:hypothetical protein